MAAKRRDVALYDPSEDKTVLVAPEDVQAAIDEGLELDDPEARSAREYRKTAGWGEALKAAAEGVGSGLTLGLSDVALSELGGDEYREGRKLRQGAFSGIETIGEVAGGIAPLLLSGGTSAAARAAAFTPTALAARAAGAIERGAAGVLSRYGAGAAGKSVLRQASEGTLRLAAGGAVEGGLAGAGMALSEAALADELGGFDALAERAWAGAKAGAMFGAFTGGAIGTVAGAARGVAGKVARRVEGSGDQLAELANERAVKALDPRGTELRKLKSESKVQQLGEDLRNYQLADGSPVLDWADNVESLAPKVRRAKAEVNAELGALRNKVESTNEPIDAKNFLRRVDAEVLDPLLKSSSPTERRLGKRVAGELAELRARVDAPPIAVRLPDGSLQMRPRVPVTYGELRRQKETLQRVAYPRKAPGKGVTVNPEHLADVARVERIFEEEMAGHVERTLAKVSPDDVGRYAEVRRLAESFNKADEILSKSTLQNLGNRAVSLTDYLTGLGAGAAIFDGGASALGGLGITALHKVARERGSAFLATLYTRSKAIDRRVGLGLAGFFTNAQKRLQQARLGAIGAGSGQAVGVDVRRALRAAKDEDENDAYDRVVARATAITQGKGIGPYVVDDAAPKVGHAMRGVQMRAAQHLVRTAPTPPRKATNPNLGEIAGDIRPDAVSLYEYSRRVRAIEDPTTLVDDLRDGTISMAAVEAVREVYPQIYADMQARVLEWLGNVPELLPYEERIRLGVMFEIPTDQTLRPEFLQITQAVYAQPPAPPSGGTSPGAASSRSKDLESMTERLESGEMPM